jgi:inosine/xanthosine triphosphatase
MKTLVIASQNPVKKQAALLGFKRMFPGESFQVQAVDVPSGVSEQPCSNAETLHGAENRARLARSVFPQADYWVGIEGGVEEQDEGLAAFAWVVVLSGELQGQSRTGTFFLPRIVAELVRKGEELGRADDLVFGDSNSKQKNGAVGLLTNNVIDRAGLYTEAVILALIPFKNPQYY